MPRPGAGGWTEAGRLAALDRYAILDTPPEPEFDDIVRLAAELLGAPAAALGLIAADRQWFKAELGLGLRELPRDRALGAGLLAGDGDPAAEEAAGDPASGLPGLRVLAGAVLRTPEGLPLGTLCVLDTAARPGGADARQRRLLQGLARQAMVAMSLRRARAERDAARAGRRAALAAGARNEQRYRTLIDSIETGFCIVEMRFDDADRATDYRILEGNPAFERMTGLVAAQGRWMSEVAPELERHWFDTYGRVALTGEPVRFENAALPFGRWYDVQALRAGAAEDRQVAILFNDISARRRAELALARSEAHWRGLFERLDEGLILGELLRDAAGRVTDWRHVEVNAGWGRLLGIAPEAAAGQTVRQLFPAEAQGWIDAMARLVETRQPSGFTRRVAGLRRWYEARAHHVEGDRFAVIFIEVTDRIEAEARRSALLALDGRLRGAADLQGMAEAAAAVITETLGTGRAGYAAVGAEDGAVGLVPPWARPGPDGARYGGDDGSAALRRGETVAIADLRRDPRGRHHAAALEAVGARALVALPLIEAGRCAALFFVTDPAPRAWSAAELAFLRNLAGRTREAIERRRAEEELRALAASLEQQVEARTRDRNRMWRLSSDIMLVADFAAGITAVNPAWTTALGWEAAELLGRDFIALVHPEDVAATLTEVARLAEGQATPRFENRYRHKDGSYRWLSWTAVPDERFIHAVGRDIQAEKAAAEALRRTEAALRQSQKMEAVGQLTGGIAHDFNNLLAGISGSLELLGMRLAQGRVGEVGRHLEAAEGAARRAAALTHRLLAFSRQQTLDPRPTDANRLIAGMEELIRRTAGPGVALEVTPAAGLWPTLVDPNQLENALLNLCINARDAMPEGGRLGLATANARLDERAAAEQGLPPGAYVAIEVADTGTGMAPEVIARAFDPFFTTKPLGQGTGLGLSMIYGFARQSGGQVQIRSAPGQGTTMRLILPRHAGVAEPAAWPAGPAAGLAAELAGAPRAGRGETVLVVDDEPGLRLVVTEVLRELGYAAVEAADGAAGLALLRSAARIDLLVTDVGLPGGMNGRQMADAARLARPGLKVLFVTGYAEAAVLDSGRLAPGMHVLTKPFALEALAGRIRALLGA